MNLIDRDALIDAFMKATSDGDKVEFCEWVIRSQPTIDPVKHGRWVKLDMHPHLADHKCTACGESSYVPTCMGEPLYNFCPNCGAKMKGDEDETD